MSQAEWNAARAKLESSPDYVMVRRSAQAGQFAGDKKGGKDGIAINWFEINKLDLPTGSGGSGPSYDDTIIKKDLADLQDEVDVLGKDLSDLEDLVDTNSYAIIDIEKNKVEVAAGQPMLTIWRGSTTEYDAITHDPDTLYIVTP